MQIFVQQYVAGLDVSVYYSSLSLVEVGQAPGSPLYYFQTSRPIQCMAMSQLSCGTMSCTLNQLARALQIPANRAFPELGKEETATGTSGQATTGRLFDVDPEKLKTTACY